MAKPAGDTPRRILLVAVTLVLAGYAATGTLGAGHHLYPLPDSPAFGLIISDTSSNGTGALASLELRCAL